jgi:hypothetical protein
MACFATGLVLFKSLSMATGLLLYATYEGCDPLLSQRIQRSDQLIPFFVLDVAGHIPGLSGLFVAGVFSAALRYNIISIECARFIILCCVHIC